MINTFPAAEAHKTTRFSNPEWARQDDTVRMIEPCGSHHCNGRSEKRPREDADATEGILTKGDRIDLKMVGFHRETNNSVDGAICFCYKRSRWATWARRRSLKSS